SRTRSRWLKKSRAQGSVAATAGSTRLQICAASGPRAGSRSSLNSHRSRPTAFTSAPRSSGSTSSRYTALLLFSAARGEADKIRSLLAHFEPVEKSVGRLQPHRKPMSYFLLLRPLQGVHLAVPRDHLPPPPSQARDFPHAFRRRTLAFGGEFPPQLVQPHQAH